MADEDIQRLVLEMSTDLKRFEKGLDRAASVGERRLSGLERRFEKAGANMRASMFSASGDINKAIAAIAVGAAIREVGQYADAWTSAGNKLAAAGVPAASLANTQRELVALANETRTALEPTVDLYARLTRSTEAIGASSASVARATEITNKAFKAGGAAASEQAAGILQLGQALGSGVLQGDELRSLRENAPLIAQAIADEFKTTIGGLKELGAEGKLTSDRVFQAILNGGAAIDAQFSRTTPTIADSFNVLRNGAAQYVGELDKATGASAALAGFIITVSENLDLLAAAAVITATVVGGVLAGNAVVALISGLTIAASRIGITSAAISAMGIRAVAGAASVRALSGALAFFGGPIGIAITGIAIAVALLGANAAKTALEARQMADELDRQANAAGLAAEETAKLTGEITATQKWAASLTGETHKLADAHYRAAAAAKAQAIEEARLRLETARSTLLDTQEAFRSERGRNRGQAASTLSSGARSGINATGGALGNEYGRADASTMASQAAANLLRSTAIVERELANLARLRTAGLDEKRFQPPTFTPSGGAGGSSGGGSAADGRAKAEAAAREAEQQRLARIEIDLRNRLELANLRLDYDRIAALEREEMIRGRISDLVGAGLSDTVAIERATADQAAYDAARAESVTRITAERKQALDLEVALSDENLDQVRSLESKLELAERIRDYQEIGLATVEATTRAISDQVRIEEAAARARARYLAEETTARNERLATLHGETREAARIAREIDVANRSRQYQERGGLSSSDATTRATSEIVEETRAAAQGAFRDAFRNGVLEAVRSGDVLAAVGEFALEAANTLTDQVLNQAADALFDVLSKQFPDLFDLGQELTGNATAAATMGAAITTASATGAAGLATAITTAAAGASGAIGLGLTTGAATAGATLAAAIVGAGASAAAAMGAAIAAASGAGSAGSGIAAAISSAFSGGRAQGGPVRPFGSYLKNERGPEPFVPTSNGVVFSTQAMRGLASLGKLAGAGGGMSGDVNVEIVNQTGTQVKAKAEKTPGGARVTLQPMFEKALDGAGRSGALGKAARNTPKPTRRG